MTRFLMAVEVLRTPDGEKGPAGQREARALLVKAGRIGLQTPDARAAVEAEVVVLGLDRASARMGAEACIETLHREFRRHFGALSRGGADCWKRQCQAIAWRQAAGTSRGGATVADRRCQTRLPPGRELSPPESLVA